VVRACDGLAGGGNWGPRPGHALGDKVGGHVADGAGATNCAGGAGAAVCGMRGHAMPTGGGV